MSAHAALVALASAVALLAAGRSFRRPSLRPAALCLFAFAALDGARLAGLSPAADHFAFLALPALLAALALGCPEALAAGLAYAAALYALRHWPAALAHWERLQQAPRLACLAAGLLVAIRRDRAPSRRVGAALCLSAGLSAALGLWPAWGGVRAMSAVAWVVAGAIIARAR